MHGPLTLENSEETAGRQDVYDAGARIQKAGVVHVLLFNIPGMIVPKEARALKGCGREWEVSESRRYVTAHRRAYDIRRTTRNTDDTDTDIESLNNRL